MANGLRGQISDEIEETIEEIPQAVFKPVQDEIGKMLETGVQSVQSQTLDPQKQALKDQEDAKKKADVERRKQNIIKFINQSKQQEQQFTQQRKVEQQEKTQEEQAEKQDKEVKQFEIVKKREQTINEDVRAKQAKAEIKRGVGG